jgi:hypothetical protein
LAPATAGLKYREDDTDDAQEDRREKLQEVDIDETLHTVLHDGGLEKIVRASHFNS